jgi:hypothetical protein
MPIIAMRVAPRFRLRSLLAMLFFSAAIAQQTPEPPKAVSAQARLLAARSIYIEHAGGRLPNDVIGDAFQGWGRYTVVYTPSKADLIVSINAPVVDSGVSVSRGDGSRGAVAASNQVLQIRLLILDAHDRVVLWSGSEQPKSAIKEKQREDHLVEASLRLFRRFRNLIEPEPAP